MKFREIDSGANGQKIFTFAVGKSELLILRDILNYVNRVVPKSFFNMPFTSRVRNMTKEVDKVCVENGLRAGKKRMKGWNPDDPMEKF